MQDHHLTFSDAQALASKSSAAVTQSTNVRSLGSGTDAWGTAKKVQLGGLVWNTVVHTALVGASAAIIVKLMSHTAATSIKSGTELARVTLAATAAAGTRYAVELPPGFEVSTTTTPHIGVTYTISGGKLTSATLHSWLGDSNEVID